MAITRETVIAANRFGLGARPGDLDYIGSYPQEWLLQQAVDTPAMQKSARPVPDSKTALRIFLDFHNRTREAMESSRAGAPRPDDVMKMGQNMRPLYFDHIMARTAQALESESPFYERLVHFWSNHFAVSTSSPQMFGLAGTLEFEAVRPHVTGYFSDMLLAVEKHPAMLMYLDNHQSMGPNSRASRIARRLPRARDRKLDINENLAREILELHTLGVNGGYSQHDVTSLARVISGWTIVGLFPRMNVSGSPGEFGFNEMIHEPGDQRILNQHYAQPGLAQGEAVVEDLAVHPATAIHLAMKLARHFISDQPDAAVIKRLSDAYLANDGYLPAVYAALIKSDEPWQEPFMKYKTPKDFVYSVFRAIDVMPERPQQIMGPLTILGQQPFNPGSPAGWPDTASDWTGGEALFKRIELAVSIGDRVGHFRDPDAVAAEALGPVLGDHTRTAIRTAESSAQGIALLLASPEFQRR